MSIKAVLFDFGGVLAEEGFKAGINETALKNSLEPDFLKKLAFDAVYETGFVSGKIRDDAFWDFLKSKTGITTANKELTETVLSRFTLRSFMIETVKRLKKNGIKTYILSDQTHWLEDLNRRSGFFSLFDQVFNSFKTRMTKKNPKTFEFVIKAIKAEPDEVLFIDDHAAHITRAQEKFIHTIWYTEKKMFFTAMKIFFPDIDFSDLEAA